MKCRYLGNLGTSEQPRSKADADAQGGSGSRKCLGLLVIGTRAFGRSWTSGGTATRSSFVIFLGTIERGFFGDFRMSWRLEAGKSYLDSYTHTDIYIYIIYVWSLYIIIYRYYSKCLLTFHTDSHDPIIFQDPRFPGENSARLLLYLAPPSTK